MMRLRLAATGFALAMIAGCATCRPGARMVYSAMIYGGPRPALPWGIRADGVVVEYVCNLPLTDSHTD